MLSIEWNYVKSTEEVNIIGIHSFIRNLLTASSCIPMVPAEKQISDLCQWTLQLSDLRKACLYIFD